MDIRGISWEYEPLLDLLAWRPDFSITLQDGTQFLIEIKPYATRQQWKDDTETQAKILACYENCVVRVGLFGSSPLIPCSWQFGWDPTADDNPQWGDMDFGDTETIKEDWNRAKNTVRWKP
jgi:hypothetical protein